MSKPSLFQAVSWAKYESSVLEVFERALNRLCEQHTLPQAEEPINFVLYNYCLEVHFELNRNEITLPFVIEFDSTNQPVNDDVRSKRLKKRPDFACNMFNPLATDAKASQVRYTIECKRLGAARGTWIFNENYTEHGQLRFVTSDHGYGKGCETAAMIGYIQDMPFDGVFNSVNSYATSQNLPSLRLAASAWVAKGVTRLSQDPLSREFDTVPLILRHLWVDLQHCIFEPDKPRIRTKKVKQSKKKKSPKMALSPRRNAKKVRSG